MPYLGESARDMEKARELYEKLRNGLAQSADDLPSEGEAVFEHYAQHVVRRSGKELSVELGALRMRQAQRHALKSVVHRFGDSDGVWEALMCALDYSTVKKCKAAYEVAVRRKRERLLNNERRVKQRNYDTLVADVLYLPPAGVKRHFQYANLASLPHPTHYMDTVVLPSALKHFCMGCCQFACELHHRDEHVAPIAPIPDPSTTQRLVQVQNNLVRQCPFRCYRAPSRKQVPPLPGEYTPWKTEEIDLLREGLALFQRDPCNLALVVRTRTCREIASLLRENEQRQWVSALMKALEKPRPVSTTAYYEQELQRAWKLKALEQEVTKNKRQRVGRRGVAKTSREAEKRIENPRYVPCNHLGPCKDNPLCTCFTKQTYCESRCACNGERQVCENGKIVAKSFKGCSHRLVGCDCVDSHCLDSKCSCFPTNVACDPAICRCDCSHVSAPGKVSLSPSMCRNFGSIFDQHKRTYVGKSRFGLGLFAGDYFEPGELVGVYYGGLYGVAVIDEALSLGQERNETYAMDLTDDLTVDALTFGSKTKFINHASTEKDGENCETRFQAVKGNSYVYLRTTKRVRPGEEFLFNYKLTHTEGNEWLKVPDAADDSE